MKQGAECSREAAFQIEHAMPRDGSEGEPESPLAGEKRIEPEVEQDQRKGGAERHEARQRLPRRQDGGCDDRERGDGAEPGDAVEAEVLRGLTPREDQARPGNAALEEVRGEDAGRGPTLEVGRLEILDEADAPTGPDDPAAQFDVLDGWLGEPGIEPAHCLKGLPTNGPEARPEGGRPFAALLVDKVVEEVAVLGQEAGIGRAVVVGAEQG